MSVLASQRTESKFEVFTFSEELHDMLLDLMRRNFGVKSPNELIQLRNSSGNTKEDFEHYRFLMHTYKNRIDGFASTISNYIEMANSIHPTSMHEYIKRRDLQNMAIANCKLLSKELQRVVDKFDVDINIYAQYDKAINREIDLIKHWRQSDNKIKSYLKTG